MISLVIALKRLFNSLWYIFKQPLSKALILTLSLILFGGTMYLTKVGHLSLFDALYTSIIILIPTSLSVEYSPETTMDKIFILAYLLTGSGTMITTLIIITKSMHINNQNPNNKEDN